MDTLCAALYSTYSGVIPLQTLEDIMPICNCEHIRHDLEDTMPDLAPEIARDGHPIFTEQEGAHPHAYVGDVCTACHETCFTN